ncbi:MAG: proline racemase family protein [Solirubrobacterales bacterium]
MRASKVFHAIDSHTEGMPTRVIVGGIPDIPGESMLDRRAYFERHFDDVRLMLMREPRGHGAMSGAVLQPPATPDAHFGILFIEVSGMLPMCGHGTIGVATVLTETGMVPVEDGTATVRLDAPAGRVEAEVTVAPGEPTRVKLRNVASFVDALDCSVTLADGREVPYDMAFGGNFYAIVSAEDLGLAITPGSSKGLIAAGLEVMAAIDEQRRPVHPEDARITGCKHVVLAAAGSDGADATNATIVHPGWIDRSPCGTGTSARMAQLHARGELAVGRPFVNESLIGTRFEGVLTGETEVAGRPAVLPVIEGRAWITGMGQYTLDPTDPFPEGFEI